MPFTSPHWIITISVTRPPVALDQVSAGVLDNNLINLPISVVPQINIPVSVNAAAAIGVLAENIQAYAQQGVNSGNIVDLSNILLAPR